ncbi:hypothetical protein HY571_02575 [Candidatus Micrarchaeota archaeon]|nr:hypothetical protein [Candidatus Micrarchaeota archaeon]
MNLHPLTVGLLLVLAFLFYSQAQFFFLFTTLAIGFLLLVVSLAGPEPKHEEHKSSSIYPEKMDITIGAPVPEDETGIGEVGKGVAGIVDFTGKLAGKVFKTKLDDRSRAETPGRDEGKGRGGH